MKIAKFIGDPNHDFDGPKVFTLQGREFVKDRFLGITGADAKDLLAKLKGNNHFEISEGEPDPVEAPKKPKAKAAHKPVMHDDDDDAPDAPPSPDKAAILARLDAIQAAHPDASVYYDKRWGIAKLQGALDAALFEHGED